MHLGFFAALVFAVALSSNVQPASGAEGHAHDHVGNHGGDPSLSKEVGDRSRFSKPVSVTGEIWVVEAHDPQNGHPFLKLLRVHDGRMYGLYGGSTNELEMGKRYQLSGRVDPNPANFQASTSADILVSDARRLPSPRRTARTPQLSETGRAGFITAFVTWPGSGPTTFQRDAARAQGLGDWSSSASNGKFRWDPIDMVEVRLSEPLAPCGDPVAFSPPVESWVETVRTALEEQGFNFREDYRALGIALPEGGSICDDRGAGAYAYYSSNCQWMETPQCGLSIYSYGATSLWILVHELGHSLGLPHANAMLCQRGESKVTIDYQQGCSNIEYGDRFDNMGTSYEPSLFNSAYNDRLGWMRPDEVDRLPFWEDVDEEVTLTPYSGPGGVRALQTGLPPVQSPTGLRSPGRVYVEYRSRLGLDGLLYPDGSDTGLISQWACREGVGGAAYVRVVPNSFGRSLLGLPSTETRSPSFVLDTTPQTPTRPQHWDYSTGLCDAGLQPGDSWQDPTGKLKIDFVQRAADLSTATIRVRSEGVQMNPPTLELEKVGEGRGKIVVEGAGIECEGRCTEVLESEARLTIRAIPGRGSAFRFWMGDCGSSGTNPTCLLDSEWGQRKVIRAGFDPDPNFPRPDIDLSSIQLTPASLKVKAGQRARFSVQVTNSGLDEGEARVSLSSSAPGKAKVPGSVSLKVPGESSATGSFTVTTRKKQRGKVTITARLGSQTARATVVLAR